MTPTRHHDIGNGTRRTMLLRDSGLVPNAPGSGIPSVGSAPRPRRPLPSTALVAACAAPTIPRCEERARRLTASALLALTSASPWAERVRRVALLDGTAGTRVPDTAVPDAVIAVPARDESVRIGRCLEACRDSIAESGLSVELLVLVNCSVDGTSEQVMAWSHRRAHPVTLVEAEFHAETAHAGSARGLALASAAVGVLPETPLLTTDADALVARDWVRRNVRHLSGGARLVCGAIGFDSREATFLPASLVGGDGVVERYRRATRELEHLLDPDPSNHWPHHGVSGGASLALTRATLDAVGGVPLVSCGEDRALAALLRGRGECVRYADDVSVSVSCRLHGRARGGMADTLRLHLLGADPPCDEEFREAHRVERDARLAAAVRGGWARCAAREALLRSHAVPPSDARRLACVDEVADVLAACRRTGGSACLRVGDLRRELPRLLECLERARGRAVACPA